MKVYKYAGKKQEENQFRPVELELPMESMATKERIEALRKVIDEHQKELSCLLTTCDHRYWYDKEGWPYYSRTCATCGRFLTLV